MNNKRFMRGKIATIFLLIAAIAACIVAIRFTEPNSTEMLMLTILSLVLLVGAVLTCVCFCKCPYCGKPVVGKILTAQYCPHCNRDFNTGAKKLEYDTLKEHAWSKNGRGGKKR